MIIAILLLWMAPQQQGQQIQDQLQRQQQQLEQIHQDLQKLRDSGSNQAQSICSVEVRRVSGPDQRRVAANAAAVVPLNLFATIGKPTESCLPAEVRIAASYLDASENLVCSGASSEELGRISSVRVRVTVFPKSGGLSTTEILLNLR